MHTDEKNVTASKTSQNGMSFVDTLPVLWCLMNVETCSWRFAMIWNEDFDSKIRTFWFLGIERKKKWSFVDACLIQNENNTHRELNHVAQINLRRGILDIFLRMSETVWVPMQTVNLKSVIFEICVIYMHL